MDILLILFSTAKLIDRGDKLNVLVDKTEDLSRSVSLCIHSFFQC